MNLQFISRDISTDMLADSTNNIKSEVHFINIIYRLAIHIEPKLS